MAAAWGLSLADTGIQGRGALKEGRTESSAPGCRQGAHWGSECTMGFSNQIVSVDLGENHFIGQRGCCFSSIYQAPD